jgi:hypothetical protein
MGKGSASFYCHISGSLLEATDFSQANRVFILIYSTNKVIC